MRGGAAGLRRTGRAGGFSLIEVVVVLVLLGIAAAATAPALRRSMATDPLEAGAAEVASILRGARRAALDRGRRVEVTIAAEAALYWVGLDDAAPRSARSTTPRGTFGTAGPSATLGARSPAGSHVAHAFDLADGVRLESTSPRTTIAFGPRGTGTPAVVIVRHGARVARVVVDPWTGSVDVRGP